MNSGIATLIGLIYLPLACVIDNLGAHVPITSFGLPPPPSPIFNAVSLLPRPNLLKKVS